MMTPSHRICGLLFVVTLLVAAPTVASVLEESIDTLRTRPISQFDHDTHNEVADLEEACALCHHRFDENGEIMPDESSEEMACRECHSSEETGCPKTEAAFHNRCKGCHLAIQQGPIACGQCHANKEG